MALNLGIEPASGVRVQSIEAGSPAALAGLREGDIVIGLDGEAVPTVDRLHQLLDSERIGREIAINLLRGTRPPELRYLPVTPGQRSGARSGSGRVALVRKRLDQRIARRSGLHRDAVRGQIGLHRGRGVQALGGGGDGFDAVAASHAGQGQFDGHGRKLRVETRQRPHSRP